MRILMLIHRQADNSPYCFYVHEQARALMAEGHDVVVLSPVGVLPGLPRLRPKAARIMAATPGEATIDGVPVRFPRYLTLGNTGAKLLGGRPMFRAILPTARKLHADKAFDLIHAHMLPIEGHAGLLLGKALGIPTALTVHGTDVLQYFLPGQPPWPRNARIAQQTGLLMAVSSFLKDCVQPYRDQPIEVVPNGVDLALIPASVRRTPRALLSGGTLKPRKCMHTTLDAFLAVAEDFPDATLTIFGEGPERASLEEKITAHGMGERVKLVGFVPHEQALTLMAQSDAFVMPSYAEGFGIVYIEAMAAGCVSVASSGEGIADVMRDGDNGFLVPAADVAALVPVLRRILSSGDAIESIRARGTETARALTWARNARQCGALYARLISDTPSPKGGAPDAR